MTNEERKQLDMMLQDAASNLMGLDSRLTRTEVNRQLMCLQDIAIIHMMVDTVLEETDDFNIQLHMVDAIMKIVWRLMEVNGMGETERGIVINNFLRKTKFEKYRNEILEFRRKGNERFMNKRKSENGEH